MTLQGTYLYPFVVEVRMGRLQVCRVVELGRLSEC